MHYLAIIAGSAIGTIVVVGGIIVLCAIILGDGGDR